MIKAKSNNGLTPLAEKIVKRLEQLDKERNDIMVHLRINEGAILENRRLFAEEQETKKQNTTDASKKKGK